MCDGELNLDGNELCPDWDIKLLGWLMYVLLVISLRDVGAIKSVAAYKYKVRLALASDCSGNCVIKFSSLHLKILPSVVASNVDCIDNSIVSIGTWPLFVIVTVHSALSPPYSDTLALVTILSPELKLAVCGKLVATSILGKAGTTSTVYWG